MIFVFKTSVKNSIEAGMLKQHLGQILPNAKWNFDLEDCDKVLRVESEEDPVAQIKQLLNMHNHICEELE